MHLKKLIKIGEYLCRHFNIKDGRKYKTFLAYYALLLSRKVNMQLKHTKKKVCVVYGEGAVTDQTCQKWFVKFRAGDFSLDDVLGSGRPADVDTYQIETLSENNQRYTTRERADILKISKSIKLLVKMKNVPLGLQKKLNGLFGQPSSFLGLWLLTYKWDNRVTCFIRLVLEINE